MCNTTHSHVRHDSVPYAICDMNQSHIQYNSLCDHNSSLPDESRASFLFLEESPEIASGISDVSLTEMFLKSPNRRLSICSEGGFFFGFIHAHIHTHTHTLIHMCHAFFICDITPSARVRVIFFGFVYAATDCNISQHFVSHRLTLRHTDMALHVCDVSVMCDVTH